MGKKKGCGLCFLDTLDCREIYWIADTCLALFKRKITHPKQLRIFIDFGGFQVLRAVWYMCLNTYFQFLNTCFQFLNNITHIFTHFLTHTYLQKIQTTLLEQHYQTSPNFSNNLSSVLSSVLWKRSIFQVRLILMCIKIPP